ncbi:Vacuolar fusion protein-like protein [Hapsidospora chrysogenum ATCC 11550]|uniref:Vacuolar fusion protein MON1 n=1 Tax=Hapsidospora chrysogenum (strain ATCC 11550 / CBS 779.69 / DSM 880 / IAM 14645 / JCM 23072 / IMI 49137) TaxID=857340 RepID=A0A086TCY7_HAPC1|nr:Vacuolar fusion protein-like protein [Hapsidospora chrysogenum ATCC 11550]
MAPATESTGEEQRPPLPPRPSTRSASIDPNALQAHATTAVAPVEIQTLSFPDGSRGTFSSPGPKSASSPLESETASPDRKVSAIGADNDDAASVTSFAPTMRPAADIASLLAGEMNKRSPAWNLLRSQSSTVLPFERRRGNVDDRFADFEAEFAPLPDDTGGASRDAERLETWKSKLKHYMILSAAGKPIWSRHGDLGLINSSIGVVQTIISFYEGAKNQLQGFTAGNARFVISTQGPLYFVAISKLGESDSHIRSQLEALYMQILSTLTLPTLNNIFANRPSSDLRKPLQGTESLLSSLADNFTRGAPSALLGSLECLRLRKSQRHAINNTFLKLRSEKLLYGLIVAGGKLVSVIRPRRHSLHPSDLQLIFNMLFEAEGIRGGGGESWIPLCLPAFNNRGYLYMYVSFFDDVLGANKAADPISPDQPSAEQEIAMVLISADKESFFELKQMRDDVAQKLASNGSLTLIQNATRAGRIQTSEIAPGSQVSHFMYKSRANVQFCMASLEPHFTGLVERRRLMTVYHELHASVHSKNSHLKVLHCISEEATSLAWVTPVFEFYCVAGPNVSRASLTQGANKIIQWAKKEEERLFIIGGGVF